MGILAAELFTRRLGNTNFIVYGNTDHNGMLVRFIILARPLYYKTPETQQIFFMILKLLRRMTGRSITDYYDLYKKWKSGWGLSFLIVDYKGEFVIDLKLILLLLYRFTPIYIWGDTILNTRKWVQQREKKFPLIHELLLLGTSHHRFFQIRQLQTNKTLTLLAIRGKKIKNELITPTITGFNSWVVPTPIINFSFRFLKVAMSIKTLEYKEETYYA